MQYKGLVLTHGAGGNSQGPLLVAVDEAFSKAGVTVVRFDLPFRIKKRPPMPATSGEDRAALKEQVLRLRAEVGGPVLMGGHSYGGRQATMLAAEEPELVEGLLLLSYPLHPPKKPEQARTAHFPQLRTKALFVQGTRDEFGTLEEMRAALALIPAKTTLLPIEGAGHDLKKGKFSIAELIQLV